MTNLADVYVTIIPETRDVGLAVRKLFRDAETEAARHRVPIHAEAGDSSLAVQALYRKAQAEAAERKVVIHAEVDKRAAKEDAESFGKIGQGAGRAFAQKYREQSLSGLRDAGAAGRLALARQYHDVGLVGIALNGFEAVGARIESRFAQRAVRIRDAAASAARSVREIKLADVKAGAKTVARSPLALGRAALSGADLGVGALRSLPGALSAALASLAPHASLIGSKTGELVAHGISKTLRAGAGEVKAAGVAALGGLALSGIGGGLVAIMGVIAHATGALALLPAAAEGAALAVGALKVGMSGFGDALGNLGDPGKLAKALDGLSPAAREAANAVIALKPQLDALKQHSQDALFQGMADEVRALGGTYLPILDTSFQRINTSANTAARSVMDWAKTGPAVGDFSHLTDNAANGFGILAQAAKPLAQAFLGLGAAGSDFLPRLSQGVADASERFARFVDNARETGRIHEWIDTGLASITQLGHALGAVGSVIATVFKAGSGAGGGFLGAIADAAHQFNDFLKSADGQASLTGFFTGVAQAAHALAPILGTLAGIIGQTIVPAISNLGTAVAPALNGLLGGLGEGLAAIKPVFEQLAGPLSQIGELLGGVLAGALPALAPAIVPLAQAFASFAAVVAPIIPPIAQLIGSLVSALAPALTTVFNALAPVVSQLVDALKPVLDALAPVLGEVAAQIAGVLAQAITELLPPLTPLVKSVGELLAALLPLLPAVVKVAAAIAGVLIEAISAVLPVVVDVIKWFVDLATKITSVVVPVVTKLADAFSWVGDKVKWVIDKIAELAKSIKDGIMDTPLLGDAIRGVASIAGHATGGLITGPGTGTSDSIVARLSDGEYVMPAAQTAQNRPLLDALRAGWTPSAAQLHQMFPGFADGGLVGSGGEAGDRKSRYVDAIVAEGLRRGLGPHEIQTALMTVSVETGFQNYANQAVPDSMRIAHDAVGSDHDSAGLFQQRDSWGTAAQRMDPATSAGLFYDQLVKVKGYQSMDMGRLAQSVQRSAFPDRYATRQGEAARLLDASMRRVGDGSSALPGSPDSNPTESRSLQAADRVVQNAKDRVNDTAFHLKQAKDRQQEIQANPKAKARQREAADRAVEVAEREHAQAEKRLAQAVENRADRLAKDQAKKEEQQQKQQGKSGQQSDGSAEDFGRSLGSGVLSFLGLDGSVLSNPLEWSGVKWLTGLVNRFTKPAGDARASPQLPDAAGGPGGSGASSGAVPDVLPAETPDVLAGFDPAALVGGFQPQAAQQQPQTAGATSVDQSVNFHGPVGPDADSVVRKTQEANNSRNRAFGLTAGRG